MCQIKFIFFSLFLSLNVYALERVTFNYDVRSANSQGSQLNSNTSVPGNFQSQALVYHNEEVAKGLGFTGTFVTQQPDYSQNRVMNATGTFENLLNYPMTELITDAQVDYTRGDHNAAVGASSYVSASPYAQRGVRASYKYSLYGASTAVGVRAQYLEQKRPLSYFYNSTFKIVPRSEIYFGQEYAIFVEQIFNKNWKGTLEISRAEKIGDRPVNYGVSLKNAFAVSNRLFTQWRVYYKAEDQTKPLYDDRGYFSVMGTDLTLTYEPIYDLLVSAFYGLGIEKERSFVTSTEVQVGSDQFGLGGKYMITSDFAVELQGAYAVTNTQLNSYAFKGGIIWIQ